MDQFFKVRYTFKGLRPAYDDRVVHVDINDTSIEKLNNFYLNRSHYAQVVRNLSAMGTSAQVFDLIFAARSNEEDDKALIEATRKAGNVYYGMAFTLARNGAEGQQSHARENGEGAAYLHETKWHVEVEGKASDFFSGGQPLLTFSALTSVSRGLGYLSIKPDIDGIYRRVPLLVRYGRDFYPSLAFRVVCDYLGVSPGDIVIRPGREITLKNVRKPGGAVHDISIPIDKQGNMVLNFIGPWGSMKHYNFADIFHASEDRDELELWREELQGKIVLISDVSTGSADLGPAPTDINLPLSGLHTTVIHTILSEQFLRGLPGAQMLLLEFILFFAVLMLSLFMSSYVFSLAAIGLGTAYIAFAAFLFFYGHTIVHVVRPVFFVGFVTILVTGYRYFTEEKEKAVLRKTFEAYFPPSVVRKIISHPELIASKGEKKELTILFSDIKNFTGYSAGLPPHVIQSYLNEYFEAMIEIVFSHEGTVDKYIGDGLMVFFGDPDPQPDHALRCVHAAIDMQKKARQLRHKWEKEGGIPLSIRIGINTGEVVVGNMGSARRLSYTVLGAPVNLAQRLEANAPVDGIMISRRTYELVKDLVATRPLGLIKVKGIDKQISVYEVLIE